MISIWIQVYDCIDQWKIIELSVLFHVYVYVYVYTYVYIAKFTFKVKSSFYH